MSETAPPNSEPTSDVPDERPSTPPASTESAGSRALVNWKRLRKTIIEWVPPLRRWYGRHEIADAMLTHYRPRDKEANAATQLPPDEHVVLPAIWVAEAYPSSYIPALLQGLQRLGWAGQESMLHQDLHKWITKARQFTTGRATHNIGTVRRPKTLSRKIKFSSTDWLADLPPGIDYAHATLLSILPGTTVFVMQFVPDDETARILEGPLRTHYTSYAEDRPPGVGVVDPADQRRQAIRALRQSLYQKCASWFQTNVPGVFSDSGRLQLPACEFIVTDQAEPLKTGFPKRDTFLAPLNLDGSFDSAQSSEWKGLALRIATFHDEDYWKLVIAGRRRDLFVDEDLGAWGGRTDMGLANRASSFYGTITAWVFYCLTKHYDAELVSLREALGSVGLTDAVNITRAIRSIEQRLASLRRDFVPFARELKLLASSKQDFHDGVVEFGELWPHHPEGQPFVEALREDVLRNAERLTTLDAEIGHLSSTLGNLATVLSNERVAQSNLRLQWIAILLSIISVGIALAALTRS